MTEHNNTVPFKSRPMGYTRHIHFVGIGGAGMSGIAEVLLNLGYSVSGSDLNASAVTARLQSLNARIDLSHDKTHIAGADVVVTSSAIDENNPEIIAAKKQSIPIVARAQMLAELMRFHHGIAIAGTHGKTTTTSLVASLLSQGGLDPTFVIGGLLNSAGAHARLGQSPYFVVEADESDASFLHFHPIMSVVTNIESDHLENYAGDFNHYKKTFLQFLQQLPFYGMAVLCVDDKELHSLLPEIISPVITYGFSEAATVRITDYQQHGICSQFTFCGGRWERPLTVTLNLPGQHNALNALSAAIVAKECGVSDKAIAEALAQFAGVGRRFQICGQLPLPVGYALLVDDYGHHPTEIAATLKAAKQAWPNRRLTLLFEPHRYSRTQHLFDDFVSVLQQADQVLLLDIYSAGEASIDGVSSLVLSQVLADRNHAEVLYIQDINQLDTILSERLAHDDVLITQGAGNIGRIASDLAKKCVANPA